MSTYPTISKVSHLCNALVMSNKLIVPFVIQYIVQWIYTYYQNVEYNLQFLVSSGMRACLQWLACIQVGRPSSLTEVGVVSRTW